MIVFSHATGNQNARAAAMGMLEAGMLSEFDTAIASFSGNPFDILSRFSILRDFKRRTLDERLRTRTRQNPWRELGRLAAQRIGLRQLTQREVGPFSVDAVLNHHDRWTSKRLVHLCNDELRGVYAYEDGATASFRSAHQLGLSTFYDLPIGYWRCGHRLLKEELQKRPDWASTLEGLSDSAEKLEHKDEELALADHILVASSFTARSLQEYPGKLAPVSVVPYGFPQTSNEPIRKWSGTGPLRLLFVGSLSQRKGIADCLDAVERLGAHVSLTIVGRKTSENCVPLNEAVLTHAWHESLPHQQVLQLMRQHDVLLFPSHFEGFGLVISEAMSQGTPVITTPCTAGPDLIDHGVNGWIVDAGVPEAIEETVREIMLSPARLTQIAEAARARARQRPWSVYGQELVETLSGILQRGQS